MIFGRGTSDSEFIVDTLFSGLRLNEDLTRGSTSKSFGFDSEELIAEGVEVFEVGLGRYCFIPFVWK